MTDINNADYYSEHHEWKFTREPYGDGMGFLPCDALGNMVYCVRNKLGHLIGWSQLTEDRALDLAIENTLTTHVDVELPANRHVVLRIENRQAFELGMQILSQLNDNHDKSVIITFMATIRKELADGSSYD